MFIKQSVSIVLILVALLTMLMPSVFAEQEFDTEEVTACIPIGRIAMKIIELRKEGHDKKLIEEALMEQLDRNMSLWIAPISKLVFSHSEQLSDKVTKKAISYCLNTMKKHMKLHRQTEEVISI